MTEPATLRQALERAAPPAPAGKSPNTELYGALEQAFEHFNRYLFASRLTAPVITLNRKTHTPGYYLPERWVSASDEPRLVAELVLHPAYLTTRPIRVSLAELVHQMLHHAQALFGKPSANGYHNSEFAQWADALGLLTTEDGQPGSKPTGHMVTQRIVEGEAFDQAADALLTESFLLTWLDRHPPEEGVGEVDEACFRITRAEITSARTARAAAKQTPKASSASEHPHSASNDDANDVQDPTTEHDSRSSPPTEAGNVVELEDARMDARVDEPEAPRRIKDPGDAALEAAKALVSPVKKSQSAARNKHKYQCDACGDAFWAKPGIQARCAKDEGTFVDRDATQEPDATQSDATDSAAPLDQAA